MENVLGHRYFGRKRNLQYLIKWKGYPTADNTWEPVEQVFSPTKIQAYHRVHPLEQPWPHKRTMGASVKCISSCFPCQTPPLLQVWRLLSLPVPSLSQPLKPMKMPPSPQLPQRYPLRSRLRKTTTCPAPPQPPSSSHSPCLPLFGPIDSWSLHSRADTRTSPRNHRANRRHPPEARTRVSSPRTATQRRE